VVVSFVFEVVLVVKLDVEVEVAPVVVSFVFEVVPVILLEVELIKDVLVGKL